MAYDDLLGPLTDLVAIFAALSLAGNILITIVGLKLPSHPKNVTQVYLISLSVADILLTCQVPSYLIGLNSPRLINSEAGTLGQVWCSVSGFLLWTSVKTNVFMVMIMGLDRMYATCYATWYMKNVNRRPAIKVCCVAWAASLVLSVFPGVAMVVRHRTNAYQYHDALKTCTPINKQALVCKDIGIQVYYIADLIISLIIPFICISFCYVRICNKIFSLKKIRTISRHFSKKDLFKKTKTAQQLEAKKLKLAKAAQAKGGSGCTINDNLQGGNDIKITYTNDSNFAIFERKDNKKKKEENIKNKRGLQQDFNDSITEAQYSTEIMRDESLCSALEDFDLNKPEEAISQEIPTTSRFSAFKIECSEERFDVCPVESSNPQKISSFNKMENHYNTITAAKDELAKKMRVYKYQLRVARTAVVICTLFIICYIPYVISIALLVIQPPPALGPGVHDEPDCENFSNTEIKEKLDFKAWAHFFLFLNSACNVIIYGLMHRTVRKQLSKIMMVCCKGSRAADIADIS